MNKILNRLGFTAARQKGSYVFYRHPDGRTTTVPNHPGRDLAPVKAIIELIENTLSKAINTLTINQQYDAREIFKILKTEQVVLVDCDTDAEYLFNAVSDKEKKND